MSAAVLPLAVRDELDRLSHEICCLASLLNDSPVLGTIPASARDGLVGIMYRWRDDLQRMSDDGQEVATT